MICAWQEYLSILPLWLRPEVDRLGKNHLQELRLRLGGMPELICKDNSLYIHKEISKPDLDYIVNNASKYSPWNSTTLKQGFITAPGGHRIGVCGDIYMETEKIGGIRFIRSLCIRVARDFPGISKYAAEYTGSILIIGSPGSGKTTFLRDLIRLRSNRGEKVGVVDERGELFPFSHGQACFAIGKHTDILSGCPKEQGIDMILRTMGPQCIAMDEITSEEDCGALIRSAWSGVDLLSTAHASGKNDLFSRHIYRSLINSKIFHTLIIMHPDKTWAVERMNL